MIREKSRDEYLEYIFKHALTQEVAYEGLLRSERRTLHRRVGEAIESLLAHRVGEYVDTLTYHFHRAGDVDKAVSYAIAAGKRAFGRHALDDAEAHFASGYELLDGQARTPAQDRLLIELLVEWSEVLLHDLKQRAAGRMLEKYWGLAERLDDPELTTRYRSVMVTPYWADLDFETAETMAQDALARAQRHGITRAEASVRGWASFSLASTGRLEEALDYARRAVELAELHGYPAYTQHWILGFSQSLSGRVDELETHLASASWTRSFTCSRLRATCAWRPRRSFRRSASCCVTSASCSATRCSRSATRDDASTTHVGRHPSCAWTGWRRGLPSRPLASP